MAVELPDDIFEELADRLGVFDVCPKDTESAYSEVDMVCDGHPYCCRVAFMATFPGRLRAAYHAWDKLYATPTHPEQESGDGNG